MSFKCSNCKKTTTKGEKQYLVPVETRPQSYPILATRGKRRGQQIGETHGWETVREEKFCFNCYQEWQKKQLETKE